MSLHFDSKECVGCRTCEVACSLTKSHGKVNPRMARITIQGSLRTCVDRAVYCLQCTRPKCIEACPNNALYVNGHYHTIKIDQMKCVGCGLCTQACVVGAVKTDPSTGQPLICDLCGGKPICAEWCPTKALTFQSSSQTRAKPKR